MYLYANQILTVEWLRIRDDESGIKGKELLNSFMEDHGFLKINSIVDARHTFDSVFIKDTVNILPFGG